MIDEPDDNQALWEWQRRTRGQYIGYDVATGLKVWRQFCAKCNAPMLASEPYKDRTDMRCDNCAIHSGNTITDRAFSPERKAST